ncbi:MAG TPA: DUF87 domain-containing protein, partial [Candidatus Dormibacteraeota bacterium]|nr:DUF87 domain-containing protein [Candidatus Dormibacteraeota bacterium]
VVFELAGPDILDVDATERERLRLAFAAWLDALTLPAQLLVQTRRLASAPAPPPTAEPELAGRLRRARADHLAAALAARPAQRRRVLLAGAGDRGPAGRAWSEAIDQLQACGVTATAQLAPGLGGGGAPAGAETARALRVAGGWTSSCRVTRLPGALVEPGWLWQLAGLPGEHDLAIHLRPRTAVATERLLRRRLRAVHTAQLVGPGHGALGAAHLDVGAEAITALQTQLAAGTVRAFDCAVTFTARAADPQAAVALMERAGARMRALLGRTRPCWLEQARARQDTLPLGRPAAEGWRLVDTPALSTCWPLVDGTTAVGAGALLGRHRRTGAPCHLDLFDSAQLPNANCAILGASGSGKSYLAGLLALEGLAAGVDSVLLDPEHEWMGLCRRAGGGYLRLGGEPGAALNVFDLVPAEEMIPAAVELIETMCGTLTPVEAATVEAAVRAVVSAGGPHRPLLRDCWAALAQRWPEGRPAAVLRRWTEGPAGALFSRATTLAWDRPLVGIGLRDLPGEWTAPATLLLARWLWAQIRSRPRRRLVVLDEAGLLLEHPALRRLIGQLARRVRKYQGGLVFVTQNPGDLLDTEVGGVIRANVASLLLGAHHGGDAARLQRAFSLTDDQRRLLEGSPRGAFLLVAGTRRAPVEVSAPPLHHRLLTAGRAGARPGPEDAPRAWT